MNIDIVKDKIKKIQDSFQKEDEVYRELGEVISFIENETFSQYTAYGVKFGYIKAIQNTNGICEECRGKIIQELHDNAEIYRNFNEIIAEVNKERNAQQKLFEED